MPPCVVSSHVPTPSISAVAAPYTADSVLNSASWQQRQQMQLSWTTQQQRQMLGPGITSHRVAPLLATPTAPAEAAAAGAAAAYQQLLQPQQPPPLAGAPAAVDSSDRAAAAAAAAASSGGLRPDVVKWTMERYSKEVAEQDRLQQQQQQGFGSAQPSGNTGSAPAAAVAAAAPAAVAVTAAATVEAAATAAAAPKRGKKRKKNNRRNMRIVTSSAAGAPGDDSSDEDDNSDGHDNKDGAVGGREAGRKRGAGRPSLIHRRRELIRKIKAILDDRGWLLYNTLVAVTGDSAGDLNNASVDAYFHAVFGPPGYMWPQDSELTHEAVQNDLYTARLLSWLTGSFVHPSTVANFFVDKQQGKTEVTPGYLSNNIMNPKVWILPLPETPPTQPGAQQTADQQVPQRSTANIHAVEDAAAAALQHYDAERAARLVAGLLALRADEAKSGKVLPPTGYLRRHALEEKIIAAAQRHRNPAATTAVTAAAMGRDSQAAVNAHGEDVESDLIDE